MKGCWRDIVEGGNPVKMSFVLISPAGFQPNTVNWARKGGGYTISPTCTQTHQTRTIHIYEA